MQTVPPTRYVGTQAMPGPRAGRLPGAGATATLRGDSRRPNEFQIADRAAVEHIALATLGPCTPSPP